MNISFNLKLLEKHNLSCLELMLLLYLEQNSFHVPTIIKVLNVSDRTVQRTVKSLTFRKYVNNLGKGVYIVTDKLAE